MKTNIQNFAKFLMMGMAIASTWSMTSCNDDLNDIDNSAAADKAKEAVQTVYLNKADGQVFDAPTFFVADQIDSDVLKAMNHRFTQLTLSLDNAKVAVIASDLLPQYADQLAEFHANGGLIIEVNPDLKNHRDFCQKIGVNSIIDQEEDERIYELAGICGNAFYLLDKIEDDETLAARGAEIVAEEEMATETPEEEQTELAIRYEEQSDRAEIIDSRMNSLVNWMNEQMGINEAITRGTLGQSGVAGDLEDIIAKRNCSISIRRAITVGVSGFQICKVTWSDPDRRSCSSTIEVNYDVYPMYVYDSNGKASGDYYFVDGEVIAHNGNLFTTYQTWHGWVRTFYHAFYSKDLKFSMKLQKCQNGNYYDYNSDELELEQQPLPSSTCGSGSYSSGFTFGLNASGNFGVAKKDNSWTLQGGVTVGASWSWNHSQTVSMSSINVATYTEYSNRQVTWNFSTANLVEDDNVNIAVPTPARSDERCHTSLCWHVKNTHDNDSVSQSRLQIYLDPTWGYMYRHATWTCEGTTATTGALISQDKKVMNILIDRPCRKPMGSIQLQVTTENYVTNLVCKNSKSTTKAKQVYTKNDNASLNIEPGSYTITYTTVDGDTGAKIADWEIANVYVCSGETLNFATTDAQCVKKY